MDVSVSEIRSELERQSADELIRIWQENDRSQWSDEAFEAIRLILGSRHIALPPQSTALLTPHEPPAMGIVVAVRSAFGQYLTFAGRARRSEFCWFVVFVWLIGIGTSILDVAIFGPMVSHGPAGTTYYYSGPISSLWGLATFNPRISVSVRRLHDLGRSGWWWWLWLFPLIGSLILLVGFASRGEDGPNRFGADPLAASLLARRAEKRERLPPFLRPR